MELHLRLKKVDSLVVTPKEAEAFLQKTLNLLKQAKEHSTKMQLANCHHFEWAN